MAATAALAGLVPAAGLAQAFPAAGTRAAGMGGAFVAVADDATAIYWNPAGLAAGSYFSLVIDGRQGKLTPEGSASGSDTSAYFLGLAMPALGLGYYRLQATTVGPRQLLVPVATARSSRNLSTAAELRLDSLITHHAGVTLVQSITAGVAVGTTLKVVRGIASSGVVTATAGEALDIAAADFLGRASSKFDLDAGVMVSGGPLKLGLTIRNVREPSFESAGLGADLVLERQARAGLAYSVTPDWVAAADFDILRTRDAFGDRRDAAFGVEGKLGSRALVRTGISVNTAGGSSDTSGPRQAYSIGGSYAAKASVYVDGHLTTDGDRTGRQWGVAARFVY